jgi:hypothetical protein
MIFVTTHPCGAGNPGFRGPETAQKEARIRLGREPSTLDMFPQGIETIEHGDPFSPPPPEFDRDEVLVCSALAFCLAGASTSIIYRLLG